MNYLRRFGAHLTLTSLFTGLIANSAKDALKCTFPNWWLALVGLGLFLFILIGSILYGSHLLLLTFFAGDAYRLRLREHWIHRFSESLDDDATKARLPDTDRDNLDTATRLRVWKAKPSVVQEAAKEMIRIERKAANQLVEVAEQGRRAAEEISHELKAGLTASAMTKSLAAHWTRVAPAALRAAGVSMTQFTAAFISTKSLPPSWHTRAFSDLRV
jgi:hypothetical protein